MKRKLIANSFNEQMKKNQGETLRKEMEFYINLQEMKNFSKYTIRNNWNTFKKFESFATEAFPDKLGNVNQIGKSDIEDFIIHLRNGNYKPLTINKHIRILKAFFSTLKRMNRIVKNPTNGIAVMKTDSEIKYIATAKEFETMLNSLDLEKFGDVVTYVSISILWYTGIRVGELAELKISDVDFENKVLIIRKAKNRKGRKIPLNSKLFKTLKSYITIKNEISGNNHLLVSVNDIPLSRDTLRGKIMKVSKECKFEEVTCHSFRRSFATRMLEQGTNLLVIKELLGHKNLQMLLSYAMVSDTVMKGEVEKL